MKAVRHKDDVGGMFASLQKLVNLFFIFLCTTISIASPSLFMSFVSETHAENTSKWLTIFLSVFSLSHNFCVQVKHNCFGSQDCVSRCGTTRKSVLCVHTEPVTAI